jgi:transposase
MALDSIQKNTIVTLRSAGWQVKIIAEHTGHKLDTVYRTLRNFDSRNTVERLEGSGRPKKLNDRDVRTLVKHAKANRRATLGDITNSLPTNVSERTVRRTLHANGINSRIAKKKPYLSAVHRKKRLDFAKNHQSWSLEQWRKVVWTDEASVELGKNSRTVRVWRRTDEANELECLTPTFKSGRTSIMVWAAITLDKKSALVIMDPGRRTAQDFVDQVYEGPLLEFLQQCDQPILMEDGASIHRSNAPKVWREAHGVSKLEWPPQSPDLNPIENLWKQLKDAVQKRSATIKTTADLKSALLEAWNDIEPGRWNVLIDSMPDRVKEVVKAKGGSTRW